MARPSFIPLPTCALRQLDDSARDLVVESWPRLARQPMCATVAQAVENRDVLLDPDRREILRFRLLARCEMGASRKDGGRSAGFVQSVTGLVDRFYATVLQQVEPWAPKPPQTHPIPRVAELVVTPIAGNDELDGAVAAARLGVVDETND